MTLPIPIPIATRGLQRLPIEDESFVPATRFAAILLRRKWLIAAFSIFVTVVAGGLLLQLSPYYIASATVIVSTGRTTFGDLQATASVVPADILALRTQVDILRSPALALRVVDHLHLVENPEIKASIPIVRSPIRALLTFVGVTMPGMVNTSKDDRQRAADYLARIVTIQNDSRSYTIGIQAKSDDPSLSAVIANTYAQDYIDFVRQLKIDSITRGSIILDQRLAPLRARVQSAETAVEAYRQKEKLIIDRTITGDGRQSITTADQSLTQVLSQLTVINNELAEKRSRLQAVQDAMRGRGSLYELPEIIASPLIQRLRDRESEYSSREQSLGQTLAGANPALQSASAALAETRKLITAEVNKIAASLGSTVRTAELYRDQLTSNLQNLQKLVETQGTARIGLRQLENEAEAARTVYTDYLRRYETTSNNASMQEPEAELISAAQIPISPAGPPYLQLAALALLGSATFASLFVLFVDRPGGGIRTAEQLEAATGLFALGFIPANRQACNSFRMPRSAQYVESIRQVGSVLRHHAKAARVIGVTSAFPREGKSVFCRSLAASFGSSQKRVLLIDGDLRHPSMSRLVPSSALPDESKHFELYRGIVPGVDLCCSSELIGPPNFDAYVIGLRSIVDAARSAYDLVILDLPSVLATADAPQLATVVDGAIIIIHWDRTSVQAVLTVCRTLSVYGVKVFGGVLTRVKPRSLRPNEGSHAQMYQHYNTYFD